ncbi:MAG: sugar transferase [Planctomycetia bacterium]|nr:sugar transferase [Planctomycetia bacterium]
MSELEFPHRHKAGGMYERFVKRALDFTIALVLIACLCPALLLIALLVRVKLGSPVVFLQERVGKDDKFFHIYKFKTMLEPQTRDGRKLSDKEFQDALNEGKERDLLSDEERMTKFGRFMRNASLDELPELLNILTGKMSFVGPRPMFRANYEYYTPSEKRRHEVLPGLTGLAQINGRSSASWESRFAHDVYYVDHISFWLDVKIFLKTFAVVFAGEDATHCGGAPAPFTTCRLRQLADFAKVDEREILAQSVEERAALLERYEQAVSNREEEKKEEDSLELRAA